MRRAVSDLESSLPRFSLERRITVLVLLATIVVLGVVSTVSIPLELLPSGFQAPQLWVQAPWQDAPAKEVLDKITLPLEEELSTVGGLSSLRSRAVTGVTWIALEFKHGTDMDTAYREVRDRLERARPRIPDDVEQVFIHKHDAAGIPVQFIGLAIDPAVGDPYNLIQNEIVLPLSRVDGVATVDVQGLEEKEILIELDRQRTAAAGLNIYALAQQLGADSFTLSSGHVRDGGRKLLLRSIARYRDREELENRLVAPSVRLRDIGEVRYEEPEKTYRVRAMSRPAVGLAVMKEGEANALEVADRVNGVIAELQANPRLSLIEITSLFDQGAVIRESLGTVLNSGRIGGLLAAAILFFFLRRVRMTLIIALAIPLSIVIALTVMFFAGESLNIMTLLALMISVGLLVDNSVVVAENIFRLHREGMDRRRAAILGTGEIALAITMATLTTIIVFLPVSLVEGRSQFFLLRLSIPISVSLVGSLVVAALFIPLAVYMTLPGRGEVAGAPSLLRRWHDRFNAVLRHAYEGSFGLLNRGYSRLLAVCLRRRLDLVLAVLAVFAFTAVVAMKKVEIVDVQEEERAQFEIDVTLPQSTTLEEAEEYFLAAEKVIESHAEELDLDGWFLFHRATGGELSGWFKNPRTNKVSPREATSRILEALPEKAGVKLYTGQEDQPSADKAKRSEQVLTLYGEDADILERLAESLEELFTSVDGVVGAKKVTDDVPSELALVVDRERAQAQGINPQVVAGVVGYALRGQALPRYRSEGREIPVRIRFKEEDRESLSELADFEVPTEGGQLVPLSTVTDVRYLASSKRIYRENKRTSRAISLELAEGREDETRKRLFALAGSLDLPEGVSFGDASMSARPDEEIQSMLFAASLSIVFIYLLMGFLFESFVLPLSILLTIPLASVGVYWVHLLFGLNIDFLGLVGLILLIGVVVNNGIVLIDYVSRLRWRGEERTRAILLAADRRFRPIMMTALTTIAGMIPLVFGGSSSIGLSYKSFGLTLIGGLTTATLLTLLVVPVFYTLFDDAREIVSRGLRHRARGAGAAAGASLP